MMLFGEYAVLSGKPALVCAVNKRVTVTLSPREDEIITIDTSLYGRYTTDIQKLMIEKPFQFILAALKQYQGKFKQGFDLKIETECSDQTGLGTSAAVTVATLAVLVSWLNIRLSPHDLIRLGRIVVRRVQGTGSGADIAAAVLGGVVQFQAQPLSAEKIPVTLLLVALYAGFKTPTVEAVRRVQETFAPYPHLLRQICNGIGQCALDAAQALRKLDLPRLGELMNIQQGFHEALGVSLPVLRRLIEALRAQPTILGAKISGSGLGDCVIGLGTWDPSLQADSAIQHIPLEITLEGVQCEKI